MSFSEELPLFNGGPLDRLLSRMGLGGDTRGQKARQVVFWVTLTWVPLLILSFITFLLADHSPEIGFFVDFSLHIRLLLALPILIVSERYVRIRIGDVIPLMRERGIFGDGQVPALARTEAWMKALRDSSIAEIVILVFCVALILSRNLIDLPHDVFSWRSMDVFSSRLADIWYYSVSLVVYYFYICRWIWRYLIWSLFLVRIATLKPNLESHHPDRMGGLSFLLLRHIKFGLAASALSLVMSANIASLLVYARDRFEAWEFPVGLYLLLAMIYFMLPLSAFTPALVRYKRDGLHRYGSFATRYSDFFGRKWLENRKETPANPLGTSDIQSLNDLLGSYTHMRDMKLFLISRRPLLGLIALVAGPFLPLLLFRLPLTEIVASAVKLVL